MTQNQSATQTPSRPHPSLDEDLTKLSSFIGTAHDLSRSGVMIDLTNLQKDVAALKDKFSHLHDLDLDTALVRHKIIDLITDLDALAALFESSE